MSILCIVFFLPNGIMSQCQVTTNLCNDLNRLAAVNVITYGINRYLGKQQSLTDWKNGFLRDVGILMVYHQVLGFTHKSDMVDDFVKTGCLLLVPHMANPRAVTKRHLKTVGLVLGGVAIYHKLIRPVLVKKLAERGTKFNSGMEDLIETILLLSMTRETSVESALTQLAAIGVYHTFLKYE